MVANVIVGSRIEPFFSACLASVESSIDFLVLNDNSGNPNNPNLTSYRNSKLFQEQKTRLLETRLSDLTGFDEARNICLAETLRLFPDRNVWILYLDTDEVHTDKLAGLTRKLLTRLPADVAVVDGYFYQFIQSFDYYASLDRRHNMLFRLHPKLRWEKPIHSELREIQGRRVPTGYTYFHYGYVYSPEAVMERWRLYKKYDSIPYDPELLDSNSLFENFKRGMRLIPFHGKHPAALSLYFQENKPLEHVKRFTRAVNEKYNRSWRWRTLATLKSLNWSMRLLLRNLQADLACGGLLKRAFGRFARNVGHRYQQKQERPS